MQVPLSEYSNRELYSTRQDTKSLTYAKKLTDGQLNPPHGIKNRTSGQSNLTTGRIASANVRSSGIHQVAPVRTPPNTCLLGPTRVRIANGISIGSAVFAQLITECPYTLQWVAPCYSKLPLTMGDLDPI